MTEKFEGLNDTCTASTASFSPVFGVQTPICRTFVKLLVLTGIALTIDLG